MPNADDLCSSFMTHRQDPASMTRTFRSPSDESQL
eukprot:CAMPEP_0174900496 /NCGR_PEP_ID=MMETSP0167-20121228/31464_1 /TAXON_ID=38298 /ORGANISM="Rhodella maculata, Strain CCMP736" /LENGTH=34 /DNA_ID= /DNA_START= /DNA_END= /DNA_ORIENTATION=